MRVNSTLAPPIGGRKRVRAYAGGFSPGESLPRPLFSLILNVYESTVIVTGGSVTTQTVDDTSVEITTGDTTAAKYTIIPTVYLGSEDLASVAYSLSDENVAEIINGNEVSYLQDGTTILTSTATSVNGLVSEKSVLLTFQSNVGGSSSVILGGAPGSVRKDATDNIDLRLVGKDPLTDKSIFTTQNHTTPTYVRNVNCWTDDLDLTGISPWNSHGANRRAGTLITPRHILFAAHYEIANGATVRFIQNDNTVVTRTMTHKLRHPQYGQPAGYTNDVTLGILDSDVPVGITHYKLLPSNWSTYLPTQILRIPLLVLDQQEKALVADGSYINNIFTSCAYPEEVQRLSFNESIISGDSGNPVFMVIGDELVLLTVWTFGGSGAGSSLAEMRPTLDSMLASLDVLAGVSSGHVIQSINLTSYNSY